VCEQVGGGGIPSENSLVANHKVERRVEQLEEQFLWYVWRWDDSDPDSAKNSRRYEL
jgi:hypothetical protein